MIPIALATLIWLPALLGLGAAVLAWLRLDAELALDGVLRLSACGALGCLALSGLGNAANFFVPLHPYVSLAGWAFGIGCAALHGRRLLAGAGPADLAGLAVVLMVSAAAAATQPLTFDEGVYHLPAIQWTASSPVPLGLGQLQPGLGFNSAWFTLAACLEAPRLHGRGLFIALSLAFALFGLVVYDGLRRVLRGDTSVPALVALCAAYPWGLVLLRGWTDTPPSGIWLSFTDAGSTYLVVLVLVVLLRRPATPARAVAEGLAAGGLALLAALGKLSNVMLVAGALAVLARRAIVARRAPGSIDPSSLRQALRRGAIVGFVAGSLWMTRGVALTGAVAYPSTVGLFEELPWALREFEGERVQAIVKAWARAPLSEPSAAVLSGSAWLGPWSGRMQHLEVVRVAEQATIAGLAFLAIAALSAAARGEPRFRWRTGLDADSRIALITMLAGLAHCFVAAPDPRFCFGFLFGLAAWLVATGLQAIELAQAPRRLRIAIACVVLACGVRCGRVLTLTPELLVPQWPQVPAPRLEVRRTDDGVVVYVGQQPFLGPLPSTTHLDPRLKMRIGPNGLPDMFWYDEATRTHGRPARSPTGPTPGPSPPAR